MKTRNNILAFNQMAGSLFYEKMQFIAENIGGTATIVTSYNDSLKEAGHSSLIVVPAPEYDRRSLLFRLLSWIKYTVFCIPLLVSAKKNDLIIISSNPPVLAIVFYIINIIKKHKYGLIIYDIYPGVLINNGIIGANSIIAKYWNYVNLKLFLNSDWVITLSSSMEKLLHSEYSGLNNRLKVVYPWVNTDVIRPIAYEKNPFSKKLNPGEKFVVLYSGNMGNSHDTTSIIKAAELLNENTDIVFVFFGVGEKWKSARNYVSSNNITNVKIFPLQPASIFPFSVSIGDISIVSIGKGSDSLMVPSKTFSYMAAGSAIIGICENGTELKSIIESNSCGFCIEPGSPHELAVQIEKLYSDRNLLDALKHNSRETARSRFSTKVGKNMISSIFNNDSASG